MRWLVAAALVACGAPGVNRGVAEGGWHELSSENFELVTDMDLDDARKRFRRLEQLRWALVDTYSLILPKLTVQSRRFRIVHFDRCRDFAETAGEGVGGYVTTTADFQNTPLMVTCESGDPSTLLHELSHIINRTVFADVPLWLNEGLASYYETLRVRDGRVRIGEFLSKYKPIWHHATFLLSLGELLRAGPEVFYALDKRSKNYFAAWKAVHMLNTLHHDRFRRYLLGLASGWKDEDAWSSAFGDLPAARLAKDYRYYQNRAELRHYEAAYHYREEIAGPSVRKLRAGEAHAVWLELQLVRARERLASADEARAAAGRHLRFMESDDPEWPAILFWRGIAEAAGGSKATAIASLRAYVKREPRDHRGWSALVALQLPDVTGLEPTAPPELGSLAADVEQLVRVGRSASDLNLIGWYCALGHQTKRGLGFARRAIAAQRSCASCWDTLALLLYQDGQPELAHAVQTRAIAMMGDDAPSRAALARLEAYRRAATSVGR